MGWNVDKAVVHAQTNAQSGSVGMCAKYTRQAIEAGGVTLIRHNSAKDYGPSLEAVGFIALNSCPIAYAKGDVAVIQGFAGHPHGHMQIFDGKQWISDFKQYDFWPGRSYRKKQPSYIVYRFRDITPAPPSELSAFGWLGTPAAADTSSVTQAAGS
jgi:hypothetical protein